MPRVRLTRDGVFLGTRVHPEGEVLDVAEAQAEALFESRAAVLADAPALTPTPDQVRERRNGRAQ